MSVELTDDLCDVCGFDSSTRNREQFITVVAEAADTIDLALGRCDEAILNRRPDSGTWSMLEYVEHIREVFLHSRSICELALAEPNEPYEGPFPPALTVESPTLDRGDVLAGLYKEATRNAEMFRSLVEEDWTKAAILMEMRWTLRFALIHIAHELLHHSSDIART